MTDNNQKNQPEPVSTAERNIDWFLQQLVEFANSQMMTFGITLNVGGILVSGTLVGGKRFFEGFAQDFADGFERTLGKTEGAAKIKEYLVQYGKIYERPADDPNVSDPTYIHLENAKFFSPAGQPIPTNRGMLWRGKIVAVDGFILGSLSAE